MKLIFQNILEIFVNSEEKCSKIIPLNSFSNWSIEIEITVNFPSNFQFFSLLFCPRSEWFIGTCCTNIYFIKVSLNIIGMIEKERVLKWLQDIS